MTPDHKTAQAVLNIDIDIRNEDWHKELADPEGLTRLALEAAWSYLDYDARDYEVSVLLGNDAIQQDLNKRYLGKDASTNVLSFPSGEEDQASYPHDASCPLGDIIVAFETVKRESDDEGILFADHFRHLLVHGMLHLAGYDHDAPDEAELMETLEVEILAGLGIKSPYADGILVE